MFYCYITKKLSKEYEKPIRLVLEKRPQVYYKQVKNEEGIWQRVEAGRGWEIVKEVLVSKEGYEQWTSQHSDK